MTDGTQFVRRNRVDERIALSIGAVAGIVAAIAGARPTGSAAIDTMLVALSVAAVVWASASAPWWAPTLAAGVAAVVAFDPILTVVGAAAFCGGLAIGLRRKDQSELRAIVAAIALNVLIRSELDGFLGLSAIIGISMSVLLFAVGLQRRPSSIRRTGWIVAGTFGALAVIALVALGAVAVAVQPDLTTGSRQAEQAIDALKAGDYEGAGELFAQASKSFDKADQRLGGLLATPSLLIPGVAQNLAAGAELSAIAATASAEAAAALADIDPASLRVVEGEIDIEAIRAVEAPLRQVESALVDIRVATAEIDSPWLLGRISDELDQIEERVDENEPSLTKALDAVTLAPQMLGADGQRRYLIMFTTPAESRGITGFFGNFAEVTIDNGAIEVTDFGRRSDLSAVVNEHGAFCSACPQEFVDRYGPYSLAMGPEREVLGFGWQNITMPAHFPYVAEAASIIYPQSGGAPIDGVIAMDPYVIQALMEYTGPVQLPELGVTVEPASVAKFILEDQYLLAGTDADTSRVDALDTLGQAVIESLLAAALPPPSDLARDLGPLVTEHRLLAWTSDPAEQELLDRINMLGALPELGDDGGFGVTVVNGGHSKIDVFLRRDIDVRIETGPAGERLLVADVTLTNEAPSSGLPRYVIGNDQGLPDGTSRMLVTLYGPDGLRSLLRDGEPVEYDTATEAGWTAYSRYEEVGPGESVTFELVFELGAARDAMDEPVLWTQPLADRSP